MRTETTIRRAAAEDFDRVDPLFEQLWPAMTLDRAALRETFVRGADSETDVLLCAESEGRIIGFCAYAVVNNLWQAGRIAYVYAMVVDEAHRGCGVGTRLLDEVIAGSRALGLKRVELDSGFPREAAHKFYESFGFEKRASCSLTYSDFWRRL
jgi:GNAT superfamily N-acetyltransferase